jgi:thymidylate synthase ThyX
MARYYVGYGHKSIGDCGTTTMFIEDVSLLAAKAFQHWPLYNGQEASTRYLDMGSRHIVNPLGNKAGRKILDTWMDLYKKAIVALVPHIKAANPAKPGDDPVTYDKAINARAFDIARCLLPAGTTTFLSWHTNLRQAADHLKRLRHHPLAEIRMLAEQSTASLAGKYANSFSHKKYESEEEYMSNLTNLEYSNVNIPANRRGKLTTKVSLNKEALTYWKPLIKNRPAKAELPFETEMIGHFDYEFLLDFGSFRDIQRHRSGTMYMPILTTKYGFHPWYLSQFPQDILKEIKQTCAATEKLIRDLACDEATRQYFIPIGYQVACKMRFPFHAAVYLAELRSGQTVHSTLRIIAQDMGKAIKKAVPWLPLYVDYSPDTWSTARGKHDIVEKKK